MSKIRFPELRPVPRTPQEVNLDSLAEDIRRAAESEVRSTPPEQYLPPAHRTKDLGRLTVTGVKNFADLPTRQIDDLIAAVKAKIAQIEAKAEAIKIDYKTQTDELTASIERLNDACVKSEIKMEELHDQLSELYGGGPKASKKKSEPPVAPPDGDAA